MARRLRWRQLSIGIIALTVVVGAALMILIFGRVGTLRGKKFRLYVATDAARGVIRGSEVWLDGQKVGLVKSVAFRSPTAPPKERLILALDVLEHDQSKIRLDTRVQVRAGANIIGDRVVYLKSGTLSSRGVVEGDTLRAFEQNDMEELSSEASLAMREFPGIIENVKLISATLKSAEGTLGAFGLDHGSADMQRVHARATRLFSRLADSTGSFGMARGASTDLVERAHRAMAQVDSIRALVSSEQHSLGRFRRDSSILGEITRTRSELAQLRLLAADPSGSFGRARSDSAIVRAIRRDLVAIDSLRADMKKHPLRYIAF
jgi:phospholipid/cholesterol/gamma-HCH transport system substrate-binding protein